MTSAPWSLANHHWLMAAIQTVQDRLQSQGDRAQGAPKPKASPPATDAMTPPPALVQLTQKLALSEFEQGIVLLCAGNELVAGWGDLCGATQGNPKHAHPTFALAQAVLPGPHWSAFLPSSPLRRWALIELGPSNALLAAPLRLDERILHALLGFNDLDERLATLVTPVTAAETLVVSHQQVMQQVVATWRRAEADRQRPIIQLCGPDRTSQRAIAAAACQALGYGLYALSGRALPTHAPDLRQFLQLWEREAQLNSVVLMLDGDQFSSGEASRDNAVALVSEAITSPLMVLSRERQATQRPSIAYTIQTPTRGEQIQLWQTTLGEAAPDLNGCVVALTNQFDLSTSQVHAASLYAQSAAEAETVPTSTTLAPHLWTACRVQARPQLDDLAQRLIPKESMDDLVLPEAQQQLLGEIILQVRQRSQVYDTWGFSQKSSRGLGISALFAGVSGTGKTMAAGVLAQALDLDLYRIDLSSVVSKYIGETEKNLRRVFDAADTGGVILLFDEADALFGKRSDVKDSHDRYANMEVSYLLQRMEAYRGLAILTTNLKDAIDPAFLRRIRFVVRFPFPDYDERVAIWQRVFPAAVPTESLNPRQLAKLNVAGGVIRNIAVGAAFLAADEGSPVTMTHLLNAAQREFIKLERPLPTAEVKGWED